MLADLLACGSNWWICNCLLYFKMKSFHQEDVIILSGTDTSQPIIHSMYQLINPSVSIGTVFMSPANSCLISQVYSKCFVLFLDISHIVAESGDGRQSSFSNVCNICVSLLFSGVIVLTVYLG